MKLGKHRTSIAMTGLMIASVVTTLFILFVNPYSDELLNQCSKWYFARYFIQFLPFLTITTIVATLLYQIKNWWQMMSAVYLPLFVLLVFARGCLETDMLGDLNLSWASFMGVAYVILTVVLIVGFFTNLYFSEKKI